MRAAVIFLLFMLIASVAFAGVDVASLQQKIENKRVAMKIPGATVAVIADGKIAWTKGFGYADVGEQRPVKTKTLFQAASITKTLTAAAVVKVLNEYGIALDEPVNRYLKGWQIPDNKFTKKVPVTFRLLLNHSAAISNPYPHGEYGVNDKLPTLLQVYKGEKPAINPPLTVTRVPGSEYKYCNGCYAILQGALESITGKPYPVLMQELVLKPVSMKDSLFDNEFFKKQPDRIAQPYRPDGSRYKSAPGRNPIYSTGSLWTDSDDLAKYAIAVSRSLKSDTKFLSKVLARKLVVPSNTAYHGLGFFIGDKSFNPKEDGEYIYHTGANIGYLTLLIISKDGRNGAVVMINISPSWDAKEYPQFEFIRYVVGIIADAYEWKGGMSQ